MQNKLSEIKIVVGYPPLKSSKGTPLLSQNRQFQYFNSPTYIYPMVPAYAASNLQHNGYKAYWMDGIAEKKTYDEWVNELMAINPDYLMIETKSPVVKTHWKIIDDLKSKIPHLKIICVGDHISYLPFEIFENCKIDYAITGGDYDFAVVNLLNHIYKGEALEGGIYWEQKNPDIKATPKQTKTLQNNKIVNKTGLPNLKHVIDELPFVDRDLTKWELYAYQNGNYKYTPGTYMYSGRDCWWNRCTFCVWDHTINPIGSYRSFSAKRLFDEVKHVVDKYGVKEIFDDAGTMFIGPKLKEFCNLLIDSGYNKKVKYGCNMRFNALTQEYYDLMAKAGFRFILYGMESGNQKTLDKLDKGTKVADTENGARMASKAGLEPHATIMLGYPWESYQDAKRTIQQAKHCFEMGYFNTMQSTIIIPYPGTPLYKECEEKDWLLTKDYDRYDMREPVMKTPFPKEQIYELQQELYSSFMTPKYIMRKILGIRSFHDFKYLFYMAWKLLAHLLDFDKNQTKVGFTSFAFWRNVTKTFANHFFNIKKDATK